MDNKFDPKTYWNERLIQNFDLIGVGDISLTMNYNIWSYKVTKYRLKKIFNKYVSTNKGSILDIGSGTGFVIKIWSLFDKQIYGIDISQTAIEQLTEKFPKSSFFEIDAGSQDLPFDDNSIQTVSAASVLYHLVEDHSLEKLLQNVHRVLQPNGYFIFSDIFIHNNNFNIEHQKCRSLKDYEYFLEKNNFKIIDRVANYVLFNDPVDSKGKFYPYIWHTITKLSKKYKLFDAVIWPVLFPLEIFLTEIIKESPAQEFIICKVIK